MTNAAHIARVGEHDHEQPDQPCAAWMGQYFRTGNAADEFVEVDRYVAWAGGYVMQLQPSIALEL